MKLEYRTEILQMDPQFPFEVYCGSGFSAEDCQNGRDYMHRHRSLEINLCMQGSGHYIIDETEYEIQPYDLFIINDLEYHRALNESGNMQLLVIVFDADLVLSGSEDYALIRAFYEWKVGFRHRLSANFLLQDEIMSTMAEMDREWQQKKVGYRMVIKALLIKLLALLYRNFEAAEGYAEAVRRFQNAYVRLAPALTMIDARFRDDLTLNQLAESTHMNRNYFSTLFSQLMGCTVTEYISRRRLRHAAQLLVSTDSSVITIAMDSGYHNVSYFNRAFHKQYGMPPGKYREQARSSESRSR